MHFGKTMRKALSVLLSAAMIFSSSAVSPVMANLAPGGGTARSVVTSPKNMQAGDVLQFDFGKYKNNTAEVNGFETITETSLYDEDKGYGLVTSITKKDGGTHSLAGDWLIETEESELKSACLDYLGNGDGNLEFKVNVPNGEYKVEVYACETTNAWSRETIKVNSKEIGQTKKVEKIKDGSTVIATTGYATKIEDMKFIEEQVLASNNSGIVVEACGSTGYLNALVITCLEVSASESFSITYDANGGTGTVPSALTNLNSNDTINLEANPSITKDGYRFVGWAAAADATTGSLTYNYSAADAADGTVTLYAVWAKEYELVYNSNGGDTTVPTDSSKYIVGEKITLDTVTKPAREGYTFLGWAAADNAENAVATLTVADANISGGKIQVYAVWQAEGAFNKKFDFGATYTTKPATGFIEITASTLYSEEAGYGITATTGGIKTPGKSATLTASEGYDALLAACNDALVFNNDGAGASIEFKVDIPAGTYQISVWAGGFDNNDTYKANTIYIDGDKAGTSEGRLKGSTYLVDGATYPITKVLTIEADRSIIIKAEATANPGRAFIDAIEIKTSETGPFPIPQNVTTSSSATSVTISWDAVANADHYNIFRLAPSGRDSYSDTYNNKFYQIGSTEGTSFTDPVVTCKEYEYYVVAVGSRDGGKTIEVSDPSQTVTSTAVGSEGMGNAAPAEIYSDRALVAAKAEEGVFVSWRLYEADSKNISFTLKRNGETVYTGSNTSFMDAAGKAGDSYTLTASEGISTGGESTVAWAREYQEFTLQAPESQTMPDGSVATYTSNDMSVGDLDGDGQLELIVKWYPSNAQDNSNDGYTGTTILDAYDIDIATGAAELMWRIDLGLNIRSGAHYTQFQVWDFDGDGKAELICKTADGTTTYDASLNETGHVGAVSMASLDVSAKGKPEQYDFRQHSGRLGRIVLGDEYLTAFDGKTGEIIDTVNYVPFRGTYDEKTGTYDTTGWGLKGGSPAEKNDGYANRCDRFLSAVAYIDNGSAAAIFSRGYYDRTAIAAWKLVNGKLAMQWVFDAPDGSYYAGQGNHGIGVNDVDGDGLDEIIFSGLVLNSDGTPRVNTQWRHGDAMHISDWDGDGQLEVYKVNEEEYGAGLYNPNTGEIEWFEKLGADTGRGVAADIDPRYSGAEMWHSVETHTHSVDGEIIYYTKPSQNFSIFWDGDLLMELFDSNSSTQLIPQVQKWNYHDQKTEVLMQADGTQLNNGTKGNAGLIADIYGDWREEIIVRDVDDNNKIRIYTTTIETEYSFPCFLEDTAYREGVAWQNVGYNQPANVTYLLSNGVKSALITNSDRTTSTETLTWEAASDGEYGHSIGGYQIYRADSADAAWADYVLAGEVDGTTLSFTDTGLKPNTEYTYVVAAVIDGKVSYKSLPFSAKTALATAGVQPVAPITVVQDAPDYETAFPATVVVTDTSGKQQDVDITWDYNALKIETPGEKTVYGTIYGREEKVPVQVTVLPNKITAVESLTDIYTLQGVAITLPETVTLSMYNNVDQEAAVTWNNNYDINTLGTYEVTGTCESYYKETASVKVTVHVAEDYIVSVEQPAAVILDFEESAESVSGKLPATVNATFAKDGRTEAVPVTWSNIDTSVITAEPVEVDGVVKNYADYAKIKVKVDYPTVKKFDFGLASSKVSEGWIGVAVEQGGAATDTDKTTKELDIHYTPERGYGFLDENSKMIGRSQSYTQAGIYTKDVYTDMIIPSDSVKSNTFLVDVENGEYIVEMISGSTNSSTIKVDIEGKSFSVHNDASTYAVGRFTGIQVADGQLTMDFTAGNTSRVNAIIIHKVVESQNTSVTEAEKIANVIENLPNADAALTPYDVTRIDKAAEMTAELADADKDALTEGTIEKLDTLYAKAHNLTLEVKVDVPAEVAANKALKEDAVSAKGMATASGAKEGVVALDIVQQKPTMEPSRAQIEFKASLTVNAREQALQAPVIITIELPTGINLNNLKINHYTDDGKFVGTISRGNSVSSTRYVLNGRTITFRTNSFSIFSLVSGSSGGSSSSDDRDTSVKTIMSKPVAASAGEWKSDATGWWYSYKNGGYAANKWELIEGKWYYFKPDGYMKTGWVKTDGVWYFCKSNGAMADAEWILADGKWYYLNAGGAMAANGWILYNNKWYYLNADGSMRKGWLFYKNNWYFLKNDGEMAADETTPDGYKVDKDGIWTK